MRRTLDQALADLGHHLQQAHQGGCRPGLAIFVYPPEWEFTMLARFPAFVRDVAPLCPTELVDVGQGFLEAMESDQSIVESLTALEQRLPQAVLQDLETVAGEYLMRELGKAPKPPAAARLLVNTGALAAFVSYSSVASLLPRDTLKAPTVLAFPGEGDDRSLNLLRLRADTNYRIPRI